MAWPKGRSRPKTPGSGRKKGASNKVTRDVQAWAQGVMEDPAVKAKTLTQAQQGRLSPAVFIELMHYAYGKPKDRLELSGPNGQAVAFTWLSPTP
jgi:hypothetical protein